jgi:hypothetical protein
MPAPNALQRNQRTLFWILVANVVATILHYTDNICFFHQYPEPWWASPLLTDGFWFLMTPLALGGFILLNRGQVRRGSLVLCAYAAASLLVLGHYSYAPFFSIAPRMHFFILLEAVLAVVLIAYVARLLVTAPPARGSRRAA